MRGHVLEDEVLLAVGLGADGAGVVLLAVHVEVALGGRQRAELQPALPAPVVQRRAVRALVEQQLLQRFEHLITAVLRAPQSTSSMHNSGVFTQSLSRLEAVATSATAEWLVPGIGRVERLSVSHQE